MRENQQFGLTRRIDSALNSLAPHSSHLQSGWTWRFHLRVRGEQATGPLEGRYVRSAKLARLEAALFVADAALSLRKLTQLATLADHKEAQLLIETLNEMYDSSGSAFRIERVASGYKLLTRPHLATWLDRVHNRQAHLKLSPPAMETLTVIAYRQPCTRADVEAVRGVQAAEMIKQLMDRNLVRVVGEDDSLGRPYLYGTTRLFLESFGLSNLEELPMSDQLLPRQTEQANACDPSDSESEQESKKSGLSPAA